MVICKKFNSCKYGDDCKHAIPHDFCNCHHTSLCFEFCNDKKLKLYDRYKKLKKLKSVNENR